MRGAVCYELGLKVGEHVMRRHYGVVYFVPFVEGHPPHLKQVLLDGKEYCDNVFNWVAKKVSTLHDWQANDQNSRIQYGHVATVELVRKYAVVDWEMREFQPFSMALWVCESPSPPKYNDNVSGTMAIMCV